MALTLALGSVFLNPPQHRDAPRPPGRRPPPVGLRQVSEADLAESALVARLRLGDSAAFETLVRTYGPRMLALARRYFKSEADAEDVLQSAYLLVFRFIPRFTGASKLSTWLHRIVVNSAFMLLRHRRRHPEVGLDPPSLVNERSTRTPAAASDAEAVERREAHRILLTALERLPDTERAAVRLCDVSGLTILETSRLVGRCSATVKRDLRRGRETLGAIVTAASRSSGVLRRQVRSSRGLPGAPLGSYAVARSHG